MWAFAGFPSTWSGAPSLALETKLMACKAARDRDYLSCMDVMAFKLVRE